MLTGEMLLAALVSSSPGYNASWANLSKAEKTIWTAMAAFLNIRIIDDGAAERDALRSQISQLQFNINSLVDTVERVEAERDAFQQLAQAKGGSHE